MMAIRRQGISVLLVTLALGVGACGSDDTAALPSSTSGDVTTTAAPAPPPSVTTTTRPTLTTAQDLDALVVSAACESRWDVAQRTLGALADGDPAAFDRVTRTFYEQLAEACPTPEEWIKAAFTHGEVLGLGSQAVTADFLLQMELVCAVVGDVGMCPLARRQAFIDGRS